MNLPNRITLMRVIMVPVFAVLMLLCPRFPYLKWAALAVFIIASLTDLVDGKLARSRGEITNFGKFMDPLADKLLVCTALICLLALGRIDAWPVILIVAREFIISGIRLIAAEQGIVLAASKIAKMKTTVQMIMIGFLIAYLPYDFYYIICQILIILASVLTVVSLIDYIIKNKNVFQGEM